MTTERPGSPGPHALRARRRRTGLARRYARPGPGCWQVAYDRIRPFPGARRTGARCDRGVRSCDDARGASLHLDTPARHRRRSLASRRGGTDRRGLSSYLGLSDSASTALERVVPAASDLFSALGWFGTLLLVISAPAFSRALERFYARVWSKRKLGFRAVWRLSPFCGDHPRSGNIAVHPFYPAGGRNYVALRGLVEFVLWTGVWLLVGWIVLNRSVSFRLLFLAQFSAASGLRCWAESVGSTFRSPSHRLRPNSARSASPSPTSDGSS